MCSTIKVKSCRENSSSAASDSKARGANNFTMCFNTSTFRLAMVVFITLLGIMLYIFVIKPILRDSSTVPFDLDRIASLSTDKTIVVTGANSGLGYSTVKLLAQVGTAKAIIMGCRSMKKCEAAKESITSSLDGSRLKSNVELIPLQLDLASLDSIQLFADETQRILRQNATTNNKDEDGIFSDNSNKTPRVDVLINNAGIMGTHDTHAACPTTGVEIHMAVNHLGHFALTSLLLPHMEHGGRVVTVSSILASIPLGLRIDDLDYKQRQQRHWWWRKVLMQSEITRGMLTYSASKRANLLFAHGLHERFYQTKNISSVAAHPGYSRTSLMVSGWKFLPRFGQFLHYNTLGSMSSEEGALPQLRAALDVENVPSDSYVGPSWIIKGKPIVVGTTLQSVHHFLFGSCKLQDVDKLWKISEDAIGWNFS